MNDTAKDLEPSDDDIVAFDIADDALEAAAGAPADPAVTFVGAPTVSILFACCSND
jgi:hypothetical protein